MDVRGIDGDDGRMNRRITRAIAAALLLGTGVHGLIWLIRLLIAQGLERAEKILSAVTLPATIVIGSAGLWLAWRTFQLEASGGAAPVPGGGASTPKSTAPQYWAAVAVILSIVLNIILVRLYLPNRLPDLAYEVRVGVSGLHPGWSKRNEGESIGSATGFDMELVTFLKRRFDGHKWIVTQVSPAEREKKIVTGEIQLVIANYSMEGTAVAYGALGLPRRAIIDFAGPYFLDTSGIMRHPLKLRAGTKVPTEKLCVARGTTAEDYIKQTGSSNQRKTQLKEQQDCFDRLIDPADSTVVATVTDNMILKARARSMGIQASVLPQPDRDGLVRYEKYGIGIPNRHPKLCDALNIAVGEFIASKGDEPNWDSAWERHLAELEERPESHRPSMPPAHCDEAA